MEFNGSRGGLIESVKRGRKVEVKFIVRLARLCRSSKLGERFGVAFGGLQFKTEQLTCVRIFFQYQSGTIFCDGALMMRAQSGIGCPREMCIH